MNATPVTPCDFAKLLFYDARRWSILWSILVFVFGATVVLFLVTSIVLFIRSSALPASLNMLGTIVSGATITWVVKHKTLAAEEEKEAFARLSTACGQTGMGFVGIKQQPWFTELQDKARQSLR